MTRLRLGLNQLKDHKFEQFSRLLKSNLLLWQIHWYYRSLPPSLPNFLRWRINFFQQHSSIGEKFLSGSDSRISETLLFGISSFNDTKNTSFLNTTIDYILSTKRFDVPFTNFWFVLKHLYIENMSLPCQFGFSSNYHYIYISISTVFILFVY